MDFLFSTSLPIFMDKPEARRCLTLKSAFSGDFTWSAVVIWMSCFFFSVICSSSSSISCSDYFFREFSRIVLARFSWLNFRAPFKGDREGWVSDSCLGGNENIVITGSLWLFSGVIWTLWAEELAWDSLIGSSLLEDILEGEQSCSKPNFPTLGCGTGSGTWSFLSLDCAPSFACDSFVLLLIMISKIVERLLVAED